MMDNTSLRTLRDLLKHSSQSFTEGIALSMGDTSITYKELRDSSERVASYLITQGVRKGEKVALLSENRPEWGVGFFSIINAGATVVVLDPTLKRKEIEFILRDSGTSFIFSSPSLLPLIPNLPNLRGVLSLEELDRLQAPPFSPPGIEPDDPAVLIYTSGTMGSQKGVVLTHKNILSNLLAAFERVPYKPGTNFLSLLPLSHMLEITVGFLGPLYNGGRVTYPLSLKSYEILEAMQRTKTEVMIVVPLMLRIFYNGIMERVEGLPKLLRMFYNLNLSLSKLLRRFGIQGGRVLFKSIHNRFGGRLRYFICGGAPLEPEIEEGFENFGIPVLSGYGLTEASPVVSVNTLRERRRGSVGKPLPGVEVRLTEEGEIVIRGENIMKGYHKNEAATKEVLKGGWLHTGDIGEMDRDGFLYIKGRKKNVIVTPSGLKIFPEELESILSKSSYIREVCVVDRNNQPYAVIYPESSLLKGVDKVKELREEIDRIQEGMAPYKRIQGFEIWEEELPKTTTRKIKRKEVKERLKGKVEKKVEEELDPFAARLRKVIARVMNIPESSISYTSRFSEELGVDSLMKVEILSGVDKELGIYIPEERSYEIETFKDLVEIARRYTEAPGVLRQDILLSEGKGDISDLLKENPFLRVTRSFVSLLLFYFSRLYFRLRVKGRENIPEEASFIIASNHTSLLDFPLIYTSLPRERTREIAAPAAKDYFFRSPLKGLLVQLAFNAFPLERFGNFFEGLKACARVLKRGKPLVLFPEGTRSIKGTLQPFKLGIGLLAYELGVPILPAYIKGAYESFPKGSRFPNPGRVEVRFGKPLRIEEYKKLEGKVKNYEIYKRITEELRNRVLGLIRGAEE